MTKIELQQFGLMVNDAISMYRAPLNDRALSMFVSLFTEYSYKDCVLALEKCCKECKYAPNPNNLLSILNENLNNELYDKARIWWLNFQSLYVNSNNDIITTDIVAVRAFKKAFGTLSTYLKSNIDEQKALEKFIQVYLNTSEKLNIKDLKNYVIVGEAGSRPSVKFIGNFNSCIKIADLYYKETKQNPYYPSDPNLNAKIEFTAKGKIFDEHGQQITAERVKELINNFIDQALDLTNPYKR